MTNKAVVVISGGMDSSTLLHKTASEYPEYDLHAISFDYGQRHKKELDFARLQTEELHATHEIVDLTGITHLLAASGSSLVSDEEVPEGHYGEASMSKTVVPNRNMIMMSIAAGYTVAIGARILATGVHAGDHFIYPDCRPEFFGLLDRAIVAGNEGFIKKHFELWTPYIYKTKTDIAYEAIILGVDFSKTWSCYKGGENHCGRCGTCVERIEAIAEAVSRGVVGAGALEVEANSNNWPDKTVYEDNTFWKEALKRTTV